MFNIFKKLILFISIITIFILAYFSTFGIKTNQFNDSINSEVKKINEKLNVDFKEIYLKLNLFKFSIKLNIDNPNIKFRDKVIKISNISSDVSIKSLIKKNYVVRNVKINSEKNEIKNLINLYRLFKDNLQILILEKIVGSGEFEGDFKFNLDDDGNIKNDFLINGDITNLNLKFLNDYVIKDLDFRFNINNKKQEFENIKFTIDNNIFYSNKITLKSGKDKFSIFGNIKSENSIINKDIVKIFFNDKIGELDIEQIKLNSNVDFLLESKEKPFKNFKLNKKFKFDKINFNTILFVKQFEYLPKKEKLFKKLIKNYKDKIILEDQEIKIDYNKDGLNIYNSGLISFEDGIFDNFELNVKIQDNKYHFKINSNLDNHIIQVPNLNYEKKEKEKMALRIDGRYSSKNSFELNNINIQHHKNFFKFKNILLNNKNEIKSIDEINFLFLDRDQNKNHLFLKRKSKNYDLKSRFLNLEKIIDSYLFSSQDNAPIKIFENLNSSLKIEIDKSIIEKKHFLNNISGIVNFKNNKIYKAKIDGVSMDGKKTKIQINTQNDELITTFRSGSPNPFVSKYSFVSGFDGEYLDFYSSKKANISNAELVINNFKLKEMPVLTKILSLASLQGVADLLTGEGIRFNEFDMRFNKENDLVTIDEIYAIGPAISILMSGYVDGDIVSLRGTLVPATTINKAIGSIPILGDILIGKGVGEGVFGVSFKIKGSKNNLKTTVNPIKTLTPRFITRTLEKIKQQ